MDAIEIDTTDEGIVNAKLSLMLISLQDKPGALCEGLLLQESVSAGVPRSEIQVMLGKSASWISNRLSLVTRLDIKVYEMVKSGLLEARSAEEIARLPTEDQFVFAEVSVREGLPKSAIESLVSAYNDKGCPDAVKAQIFEDPRQALKRLADKRRAVKTDCRGQRNVPDIIDEYIKSMSFQTIALRRKLSDVSQDKVERYGSALKDLEAVLQTLLIMIQAFFTRVKTEVDQSG
jgi:ParB-like chromosome segregation protein Spo0J